MDNVLEKIYKAGLKFLVPLTPEETYKLIVEEAVTLIKADFGSIFLVEQGQLQRIYASNYKLYQNKPRKRGFMFDVFKTRKLKVISIKQIGKIHPFLKKIGVHSIIGIPLSYRNQSIGVLNMMSHKDILVTKKDINMLLLFGQMATLAIRKTQLYDGTKKALEARDLFISMAAHELRTPITTISGYIQLLSSKLSGSNSVEAKWIKELSWESFRLTQLVNELLAVDRIKAGEFQYIWKECSLKEIINRALIEFRFTYPKHKIILEDKLKGKNDQIVGDYNKLLQVVINLLDNAAKFSPPDKQISLILRSRSKLLTVEVKDKGSGIQKRDLSGIFEKFYRGRDHTREGMGLGLFLAKNIIEQHHGRISISSKERKGTLVEVKLPKIKNV